MVTLLLERLGVRPSFNISNVPKAKHTGYQYDALGRNTQIPAADTPNGGNAITLAYNTNDQVTQISQAGATTNFSYEAEGRRLNETSGNTTTTRHYTDSSDNPTWSTQATTAAPNTVTKTEIYTPSLGSGLNVTTTIQNGTQTGLMQLHDLRGHTVTTIDLATNTATGWCSYDEFGNQDSGNPASTNLINYSAYGQAERATNTTGLILMGARVYNPETNQFTSRDPIAGGNENYFAYPNDSVGFSDMSGSCGVGNSFEENTENGEPFCLIPPGVGGIRTIKPTGPYSALKGIKLPLVRARDAASLKGKQNAVYVVATKLGFYVGSTTTSLGRRLFRTNRGAQINDSRDGAVAYILSPYWSKRQVEAFETTVINQLGGLGSSGGNLLNQKNPVAKQFWQSLGIPSPTRK